MSNYLTATSTEPGSAMDVSITDNGPGLEIERQEQESFLMHIAIHGNEVHASTGIKVTSTLTAGEICRIVCDKIGVSHRETNFFSLIIIFTITENGRPQHKLRTLKYSDNIFNVINNKEKRTPPVKSALYRTKWYLIMLYF